MSCPDTRQRARIWETSVLSVETTRTFSTTLSSPGIKTILAQFQTLPAACPSRMLANIRTRFPRSRLSASGNKFSAPFYLSTRYEWIQRGYSIVPGNNEGKSWFAKRTLLRHSHAPNHALNQAKLRPQIERNYYHDSACCASGTFDCIKRRNPN